VFTTSRSLIPNKFTKTDAGEVKMQEKEATVSMTAQFKKSGEDVGSQESEQETLHVARFPDGSNPPRSSLRSV
jgi:hypothetical protein